MPALATGQRLHDKLVSHCKDLKPRTEFTETMMLDRHDNPDYQMALALLKDHCQDAGRKVDEWMLARVTRRCEFKGGGRGLMPGDIVLIDPVAKVDHCLQFSTTGMGPFEMWGLHMRLDDFQLL